MPLDARNVILVLSGKGGVGKSTVSVLLSLSLLQKGFRVGLLDIDLCGPSIPKMLGLGSSRITQSKSGFATCLMADGFQCSEETSQSFP
jgi:Mrp family chromosome partitioning ATPase